MKRTWAVAVVAVAAVLARGAMAAGNSPTWLVGGGVHYWRTIDDLSETDGKIDSSGIASVASLQCVLSQVKLETDLEIYPHGFGFAKGGKLDEPAYAPQAFLLLGNVLYVGVGVGINYSDGAFADDPYYILRGGVDLEVLPGVHLDLNANYMFIEWDRIDEVDDKLDDDTITLGAAVRLAL